jgi:hypothetical protein
MSQRDDNYGPVYSPLPVDWSAYKIHGWTQDALDAKIKGRQARSIMRRFRSVPVTRRAWWTTLTATSVQEAGRGELVAGLVSEPQALWCRSRRKARALVEADKAAGGQGMMYPVEYRHCAVCGRRLLGPAAHDYRVKQLRARREWQFEDGPACSMECKPGRKYKKRRKAA